MAFALIVLVALLGNVYCQFGRENILNECREKEMDIFFLLDSSTSIYINDYREQHEFVRQVVNRLDIGDLRTRVGALTFSDDFTRPVLSLTRSRTQGEVSNSISELNLPYRTGVTNTHLALRFVRENNEFRPGVTKVMVVVTDGGSRQQAATAREADLAREEGFYVFVVGVGQYRDESEWRAIASDPDDRFVFNVTEFRQLSSVASQLPGRVCPLPPLRAGTCDVLQESNVIFVAGPASNQKAYDIVEDFTSRTRDSFGRLSYTVLMDICQGQVSGLSPTEIGFACDRLRNEGVPDDNTYPELIQQIETEINQNGLANRFFTVPQVVVLFMDAPSLSVARYNNAFADFRSLGNRNGVEVVFVGIGLSRGETAYAQQFFRNTISFNSGSVGYQDMALREVLDATCDAVNRRTPSIAVDPN